MEPTLADAWQRFQFGDLDEADRICKRILAEDANCWDALYLRGIVALHGARPQESVELLEQLREARPHHAEVHISLGNALAVLGRLRDSISAFQNALHLDANRAEAHHGLANVLRDSGEYQGAESHYRRAVQLKPDFADAFVNLGILHARRQEWKLSENCLRRALELRGEIPAAHNELGIALAQQGRRVEAKEAFLKGLEMNPGLADAQFNLGLLAVQEGNLAEAEARFQDAVSRAPRFVNGYVELAKAMAAKGNLGQAITPLQTALQLAPRDRELQNLMGRIELGRGEIDAALVHARKAISLDASFAADHLLLAEILEQQAAYPQAQDSLETAIRLAPEEPVAHVRRAQLWLRNGDYARGWREADWRLRHSRAPRGPSSAPTWDGTPASGRRICVYSDGNLRDTLQLLGLTSAVRPWAGQVIFCCDAILAALIASSPAVDFVHPLGELPPPDHDVQVPLLSLPRLLGVHLENIPATDPYLFAEEAAVENWKSAIPGSGNLRVGICGSAAGSALFAREHRVALDAFLPLADIEGVDFYTIPPLVGRAERNGTGRFRAIEPARDEMPSAVDLAGLLMHLDLVISADNELAHIAGAMGVPVWILLPRGAEWRWHLDRSDSPWYPTAELFRCTQPGDWSEVIARVAARLKQVLVQKESRGLRAYPHAAQAFNARGADFARRGDRQAAERAFQRALSYNPLLVDAHTNLGNLKQAEGNLEEALSWYHRALEIDGADAEALMGQGVSLARSGNIAGGIESLERAVASRPRFVLALQNLGIAYGQAGRRTEAAEVFRKAIEIDPAFASAWNSLGRELFYLGQLTEAVACLRRRLTLDGETADALAGLGCLLRDVGQIDEGIALLQRAVEKSPNSASLRNDLGIAYSHVQRREEATECFRQALLHDPDFSPALNNLGISLSEVHEYGEAMAAYRKAIGINPNYPEAHNNLGIVLSQQGDYDEAIAQFRRAIEILPTYAEAYSNLGIALTEAARLDEAEQAYAKALELKTDYPDAHMNRALALLVRGDFANGWREYEWRWRTKDFKSRRFGQTRWEGEPLDGKRILLHSEQGLGDTLQFIRYARNVKQRGGHVIARVPAPLKPLLSQCDYLNAIAMEGGDVPDFDVHIPLLSLPLIFETTLESLSNDGPYLRCDANLLEHWRTELAHIHATKVAIAWQGNPRYRGDRHRSIPVHHFRALSDVPGVRLVSIQKGFGTEQLDALDNPLPLTRIPGIDDRTGPFMDTAAIMCAVDLVITSDTAVAHLAGGLGVTVWLALPYAADWRWLLHREDCPWYPRMRLFRQSQPGDWAGVFSRMSAELKTFVNSRHATPQIEVSPGELMDKLTILEIKLDRVPDPRKLENIRREWGSLRRVSDVAIPQDSAMADLWKELRTVNESLWEVEDQLRILEANQKFSEEFVALARSVYRLNDHRAALKRQVNDRLGAKIVEEKSYVDYGNIPEK